MNCIDSSNFDWNISRYYILSKKKWYEQKDTEKSMLFNYSQIFIFIFYIYVSSNLDVSQNIYYYLKMRKKKDTAISFLMF